jgi:hypothetical protein
MSAECRQGPKGQKNRRENRKNVRRVQRNHPLRQRAVHVIIRRIPNSTQSEIFKRLSHWQKKTTRQYIIIRAPDDVQCNESWEIQLSKPVWVGIQAVATNNSGTRGLA